MTVSGGRSPGIEVATRGINTRICAVHTVDRTIKCVSVYIYTDTFVCHIYIYIHTCKLKREGEVL